jgi:aminoglycoside phosphotransferase (APT) family kinase protein
VSTLAPNVSDNTGNRDRSSASAVLKSLEAAFDVAGRPRGRLFFSASTQFHARSTIYFVGDATQFDRGSQWVVKRPKEGAAQEDLENPLGAEQQFEALRLLAAHFEPLAPTLRVPAPVAFLPELGALAMEYASGTSLDRLIASRGIFLPNPLLEGIALAARLIRHVHALEPPHEELLRPRALADEILALWDSTMQREGLLLPAEAVDVLEALPDVQVRARTVRLHGDFAPVNMILDAANCVTGIDASLSRVGIPEEDLARFLMMLATEQRLFLISPEVRPLQAMRRRAESALLESYYGEATTSVLLELRLIEQLCRRWLRRHMARMGTRPSLEVVRRRAVDRYFAYLLRERCQALACAPCYQHLPSNG